jgi:predicted dehydrogenase
MTFPSGILSTGNSTYGTQMQGYFKAFGTKGQLEMDPAYNYDGLRLRATYEGAKGSPLVQIDEVSPERDPLLFARQADHLAECIRLNQTPRTPGEEGLRDMHYLQAIYASAGITMGS